MSMRLALFLLLPLSLAAYDPIDPAIITPGPTPTLAGISSWTPLKDAQRILGKPRSVRVLHESGDEEFGITVKQRLTYTGLIITVIDWDVGISVPPSPEVPLCVLNLEITGRLRPLSNSLRVGMTVAQALRIMGKPLVPAFAEPGGITTYDFYYADTRELILTFRRGILRRVELWQGLQC